MVLCLWWLCIVLKNYSFEYSTTLTSILLLLKPLSKFVNFNIWICLLKYFHMVQNFCPIFVFILLICLWNCPNGKIVLNVMRKIKEVNWTRFFCVLFCYMKNIKVEVLGKQHDVHERINFQISFYLSEVRDKDTEGEKSNIQIFL